MGKYTDAFNRRLILTYGHYQKDKFKTYLTTLEWRNVEMAEEYAEHLKESKPFFTYPYFRQVFGFWRIFFNPDIS